MIRRVNILFSWILYSHKVQLFINSQLAREKDTILHASDFGYISVVKTSSPSADGSLVCAHGAKSSPIVVSPAVNLPTIVASESSSLSAVANSDKIRIAVNLGNSVAPLVSETTTTQDAVVYGDGFSSKNKENVKKDAAIIQIEDVTPSDEKIVKLGPLVYESKAEANSAFRTLLESVNIRSDCMWDQAISIVTHDEHFKVVERSKDREDLFEDYVEKLEKKVKLLLQNFLEHAKALEEQKRNRVKYLEFLKSCDFIEPLIPPLTSPAPGAIISMSLRKVNADSSGSQYQTQINDHRFPSGVQPWMPISNHNVNSATTTQKTGELAAPLVVQLAHEKGTISYASNFGSISVVKISSPGVDGSLVSAHDAKSSPIDVSPAANLPTIVASESSSLFGMVSSSTIETVKMKNSLEPASPVVANSEKIGIAVTLGNFFAPPVYETTTNHDAVVYGDGFSSEYRENVKKDPAIIEIGGTTPSDEKTVRAGTISF
ncbi:hypothetical protein CQW23_18532 [Capsicum baccatum]|uniref:FF domain-containing protein n=1 Tax=Capsicum baccatum TaxID=33114 RepID=A0A2G2W383_CAPBA|nr:hypothetical protein CQW23_18532 [Capsicum baccatum]